MKDIKSYILFDKKEYIYCIWCIQNVPGLILLLLENVIMWLFVLQSKMMKPSYYYLARLSFTYFFFFKCINSTENVIRNKIYKDKKSRNDFEYGKLSFRKNSSFTINL